MAIQGRLDELQASDVVQFLTQSGRSGTLRLTHGPWSKWIAFENGRLIYAVSQHEVPRLTEVLYQRGRIESPAPAVAEGELSESTIRALEWRYDAESGTWDSGQQASRLGRVLVRRGIVEAEALQDALQADVLPCEILGDTLLSTGVLSVTSLTEARAAVGEGGSLHSHLVTESDLTLGQLDAAVLCMPDAVLARYLKEGDLAPAAEVDYCAQHLETLCKTIRPRFRLGEVLVASGRLTAGQIELAQSMRAGLAGTLADALVATGEISEAELAGARSESEEIRSAFAPLRAMREMLEQHYSVGEKSFQQACANQENSDGTLAAVLVASRLVAEADLRQRIEALLAHELSDLMLWDQGEYQFFDQFTLGDGLGEAVLDRIHSYAFEVSSLLLDAHYRVEELRKGTFRRFDSRTIFSGPGQLGADADVSQAELRLMRRMDGRRTVGQVCAVLPGTRMSHRAAVARLLEHGWITALQRGEAAKAGVVALTAKQAEVAIGYFTHALRATGEGPEDRELEVLLQEARVLKDPGIRVRVSLACQRLTRRIVEARWVSRFYIWSARQEFLARPVRGIRSLCSSVGRKLIQMRRRTALSCQDFSMQKGLSRTGWNLRRRMTHPALAVEGRTVKIATALAVVGIGASFMVPGVAHIEIDVPGTPSGRPARVRRLVRAPARQVQLEVPVEVKPAIADDRVFVAARDGMLRCYEASEKNSATPVLAWEEPLGEFGDPLSAPAVFQDQVFVANVRGQVHAVGVDGTRRWTKEFPRVERIQPVILLANRTTLAGVVIVARESVFVLHPEDGRILYRLQCGNEIEARPVVSGDRLFVGASDNHVYCANWRTKKVLWDTELGKEDVLSLALVEDHLVARTRGGEIVALDHEFGSVAWRHKHPTLDVEGLHGLSEGRVAIELSDGGGQIGDAATGEFQDCVRPLRAGASSHLLVSSERLFYYSDMGSIGEINPLGADVWRSGQRLMEITSVTWQADWLVVTSRTGSVWMFTLQSEDSTGGTR